MSKSLLLIVLLFSIITKAQAQTYSAEELEAQGMIKESDFRKKIAIEKLYRFVLKRSAQSKSMVDLEADRLKATVVLEINKAKQGTSSWAQKMRVYYKGDLIKELTVSTAKEIKVKATNGTTYLASTPVGYWRPQSIWKQYQSSTWVGAYMNFALFFTGGIAVHSTTPDHYAQLGTRDSGGCVRLHPTDAQWVNELALTTGLDSFEIINRPRVANGRKLIREEVVGGAIEVAAVNRVNGALMTKKMKSWDVLIIVRDMKD